MVAESIVIAWSGVCSERFESGIGFIRLQQKGSPEYLGLFAHEPASIFAAYQDC